MRIRFAILFCLFATTSHAQTHTTTFENLPVPASGFFNGGPSTNTDPWVVDRLTFSNNFTDFGTFTSWNGWSYSNVQDSTTAGFGNQYAAFPGGGSDGSGGTVAGGKYAIASGFSKNLSYIDLPTGRSVLSADVTNATYAALSIRDGDSFAKKFGGTSGNDPDFFQVTFTGYDGLGASGGETGSVTFDLADYRFADNSQDFIVDQWTSIDLSSLNNARSVGLEFAGSDVGQFGLNTPAYIALDNLVVSVPEPSALGVLGLVAMAGLRRKRNG